MPNTTIDIRDLQRLPLLGGLEEADEHERRECATARSCGLVGYTYCL
jgi:hypothetical protein